MKKFVDRGVIQQAAVALPGAVPTPSRVLFAH